MSTTKPCTICQHAKRAEIDDLLVKRTTFKRIAEEFGVGIMSVWRHSHNGHVLKAIAKAHEAAEVARGDDLLQQVRDLQNKMDALFKHVGIEPPPPSSSGLSPEVERLAGDPSTKVAAIQLYREENPGVGLAEAKAKIDAFCESKK